MSATYQQGLLTLQRKRTDGNQQVTVKHIHQQVNVTQGGQAVVAGDKVTSRTRGRRASLHVRSPSVHPMQGDEIRALRRLQREQEASPYVFTSERGVRCRLRASARCSSASAGAPVWPSPSFRICCATPAAMPWLMPDMTRGPCRHGLGTRISSTRCATRSWRRDRFKDFWR